MKNYLALFLLATTVANPVAAAPTTYLIDQPIWGPWPFPSNFDGEYWQERFTLFDQQNPGFYHRLTGQLTVDWSSGVLDSVELGYSISSAGGPPSVSFTGADLTNPNNVFRVNSNSQVSSFSLQFEKRFGDLRQFEIRNHPTFLSLYADVAELPAWEATLSFNLNRQPTGELTLFLQSMRLRESRQNFSFGAFGTGGSPIGGHYVQIGENPDTRTACCDAGVTLLTDAAPGSPSPVAPVPLPGAAWLMLSGLAAVGLAGRRPA